MAIVHAIGKPENKSERKAIAYLTHELSADHYLIFHNLELPNPAGLPYEYDLIIVGKHAVFTLEVKGYRGRIRGNAKEWQLSSGFIHRNPMPLCNKKAKVLAEHLRSQNRLLRDVWVQPLILLTNDRVRVNLNDPQADRVLRLDEIVPYIRNPDCLPVTPTSITHFSKLISDAILNDFRPLQRPHEIGDYRVIETVNKNDFYTMLLAEHGLIRTQGRFNLKVYSLDVYAGPEVRRRQKEWMLRDANALHRLSTHDHIARAHPPFLWQDNQIVLPLDWVEGFSLRGLLDEGAKMDFSHKVDIVRQVCEGLSYAHDHGVIHRDVRPENVIIPQKGSVKLVNFDCARVAGLTTIRTRVGRRLDQRYVAPEVWEDAGAASPASDQYAAGVLLFELLAGQLPYQKIKKAFSAQGLPRTPTQVNPDLPPEVDEVLAGMCAFQPAERYESMARVVEDLTIIS